MAVDVHMPGLGDMDAGILLEWVKRPGDHVSAGEVIAVVDADKVNVDVPAPAAGYLEPLVAEGQEAKVGTPIARLIDERPEAV